MNIDAKQQLIEARANGFTQEYLSSLAVSFGAAEVEYKFAMENLGKLLGAELDASSDIKPRSVVWLLPELWQASLGVDRRRVESQMWELEGWGHFFLGFTPAEGRGSYLDELQASYGGEAVVCVRVPGPYLTYATAQEAITDLEAALDLLDSLISISTKVLVIIHEHQPIPDYRDYEATHEKRSRVGKLVDRVKNTAIQNRVKTLVVERHPGSPGLDEIDYLLRADLQKVLFSNASASSSH